MNFFLLLITKEWVTKQCPVTIDLHRFYFLPYSGSLWGPETSSETYLLLREERTQMGQEQHVGALLKKPCVLLIVLIVH